MITGGSRGVGLAAAGAFARRGWWVALAGGADARALEQAVATIEALGVTVTGTLLDVRDPSALKQWVERTEDELGPTSVAIASAGNLEPVAALELSELAWDRTIDTHLKGTFFFLQAVARRMAEAQRPGSLITLTSFGGVKAAAAGLLDYSVAKGGIVSLTRTLAREWLPLRIRVNAVLPAAETRMTNALREFWHVDREVWNRSFPGGVMPTTEEIADVFWFLGSPAAAHVTGQVLAADAGFGLS